MRNTRGKYDVPNGGYVRMRDLNEESMGITENVYRAEECIFETSRDSKEIETIPEKTTILHTKKERILKAEEDPGKPWYFTQV
jgi:hypothetical protein